MLSGGFSLSLSLFAPFSLLSLLFLCLHIYPLCSLLCLSLNTQLIPCLGFKVNSSAMSSAKIIQEVVVVNVTAYPYGDSAGVFFFWFFCLFYFVFFKWHTRQSLLLFTPPPPTPTCCAEKAWIQTVHKEIKVKIEVMSHHVFKILIVVDRDASWLLFVHHLNGDHWTEWMQSNCFCVECHLLNNKYYTHSI